MAWLTGIVLILSIISFSGALLHGNSNTSASSNVHTDLDVYKQLLHLETTLNSVYKEMTALKEQNLQQQKTFEEQHRQQQKLIESLNNTIQHLEASFQEVKSENGILKDKLLSLNSTFYRQNYSNVDDITKELKLQTQNLSLAIMELNKSSSEDIQTLRNIFQRREQEVPKNITSVVNTLKMNDRYISLSFLDVQNNITALGLLLQQQQKTQTEQHKLTQAGIQNLTYSLNNSTAITQAGIQNLTFLLNSSTTKLSSSLSDLKTRFETSVAFTAGVRSSDTQVFSPGQTVIFKQIIYQVGGGYNPTTGVFTVPKTGLYLIFCTNVAYYKETFWTKIMINGSVKAGVMAYLNGSLTVYLSASNLVVHQLQVGDRVWIQVDTGTHLYSYIPDTTFSAVMINGSV
ncbi:multimerin-1-like [Saccostrea cucullata]|uniref:multimerin-1-like n=1 Tax=Saccostrea cuccullata TaxID=36930 RepID=UPI002ED51EFB